MVDLGAEELRPKFEEKGCDTHGNFCFSAAHDNGTVTNTLLHTIMPKLVPEVAGKGGAPANLPKQAAAFRRMFYESHVLYVGQLRVAVEKTDDERSVRMQSTASSIHLARWWTFISTKCRETELSGLNGKATRGSIWRRALENQGTSGC